jgi:hypothetical protein
MRGEHGRACAGRGGRRCTRAVVSRVRARRPRAEAGAPARGEAVAG